jgi:endonuclease-3
MAYLCLSTAWGRDEGIGVDVHVHRITNLWGWHTTKGPEESRIALQSWLPKEKWREINWALVGLGQTVCLPVGRKCGDCEVGLRGLCKSAERSKVIAGKKLREERIKIEGNGVVEEKVALQLELTLTDVIVNASPNDEVKIEGQHEEPQELEFIKSEKDIESALVDSSKDQEKPKRKKR